MIHVMKHDMDPNSNINYRRKIGPLCDVQKKLEPVLCFGHRYVYVDIKIQNLTKQPKTIIDSLNQ